jgi:hypothetical protein
MKDDRLRVPVEKAYVEALGLATFAFARLEWDAVWCCERMKPGYINNLKRKTAGTIAKNLVNYAGQHPYVDEILGPSQEFKRLVKIRNALLHAKPGTWEGGEQYLFDEGQAWTPLKIDEAADEFTACSLLLNALLHGRLQ